MNLDTLRKKRVKRKGTKTTAYTGQRHIFNILDRATRKFHGDLGLWMQYIDYARSQKANKKLTKLLTEVIRMHPTKPEVWIYAARYAMDVQADANAARSYMQRGLRFNQRSKTMYLEHARLEMGYISKLSARRKILGIGAAASEVASLPADPAQRLDDQADMIELPTYTAEDLEEQGEGGIPRATNQALSGEDPMAKLLSGAIPLAIFDNAMQQFDSPLDLAEQFYTIFSVFTGISALPFITQQVLDRMVATAPESPPTQSCFCRQPLAGISIDDPVFPAAIGDVLKRIRVSLAASSDKSIFAKKVSDWLVVLAADEQLAPELKQVIAVTLKQLAKQTT